jgi:hypothetical protein
MIIDNITSSDILAGRIRIKTEHKYNFQSDKETLTMIFNEKKYPVKFNPRNSRSHTIYLGELKHLLLLKENQKIELVKLDDYTFELKKLK